MSDFKRVFDEVNYKLNMCRFSNEDRFKLACSLINLAIYDETADKNFEFSKISHLFGCLVSLKEEIFINN